MQEKPLNTGQITYALNEGKIGTPRFELSDDNRPDMDSLIYEDVIDGGSIEIPKRSPRRRVISELTKHFYLIGYRKGLRERYNKEIASE